MKHRKAEGFMDQALERLAVLAGNLSEEETSLKVKCLLKVKPSAFMVTFSVFILKSYKNIIVKDSICSTFNSGSMLRENFLHFSMLLRCWYFDHNRNESFLIQNIIQC